MKYDFRTIVDRTGLGAAKWEQMKQLKPDLSEGVIPFSVADMEFKNPPEIIEGLKEYLDIAVLGYTMPTENYLSAVCGWMKRRHLWEIDQEWIVGSEGVVSAIFLAIRAFSDPGEGVIIQTPVYHPFYDAIEMNRRKIVRNSLVITGDTFEIDYEDLERKAQDPHNRILLFCNPHNPTGRVWSRDELTRIGDICLKNNVMIISDEIHFDLIMPGHRQTVFASLSNELSDNMIVCTAPSKTFNLAGMHASNIIISNPRLRKMFVQEAAANGFSALSILGYKACEIGYTKCEAWLDELNKVIYDNHLVVKKFMKEKIPRIKVFSLEGTYLQWMDFRGLGLEKEELEKFLHNEAELFFSEGYVFGEEGAGFERMNLACPTRAIVASLNRLAAAVHELHI